MPDASASPANATAPIALTMGDPAGIGPEIIAQLFGQHPDEAQNCLVAADIGVMRQAVRRLHPQLTVAQIEDIQDCTTVPPNCMPVLHCSPVLGAQGLNTPVQHGQIRADYGQAAADCVMWAAKAALRQELSAIVTAPVHKQALAAAGLPYPGHTEILQTLAAAHLGRPLAQTPVRMMLSNAELRTVLVSIHLPLRQAIEGLSTDNIAQTIAITHRALQTQLGRAPRIAVAGLNPHAGEGGLLGHEDAQIIAPAVAWAQSQGIQASGPHAPDTVFMRARQTRQASTPAEFDVVVAMYHDQGLIPVKYMGIEHGVNTTLGLPLCRTSPDHGTAFDIAGRGLADASSLRAALRAARLGIQQACVRI